MRAPAYLLLLSLSLSLFLAVASLAQECIDYRDYPHLVGRVDWPSEVSGGVAVAGNYAYVAIVSIEGTGLRTIDISNPSAPAVVGEVYVLQAFGQPIDGLTVAGSLVYMTVGNWGLQIVDISNPESPSAIGGVDTPGTAFDVAVDGTHAYIADGELGLQVVDVSNPASPVLVASFDTNDARGIVVADNYAFIADRGILSRLLVIDISNPVSPTLAGSLAVPGQAEDVAVNGTLAWVACRTEGLQIVDISNPFSPQLLGVFNNGGATINVTVEGGLVYAGTQNYLSVVNADPPTLVRVGVDSSRGIAVAGAYAYFTGNAPDFGVVDFSSMSSPPVIGQLALSSGTRMVMAGNYAYLTSVGRDLVIVDISNPESPVLASEVSGENADDVAVAGSYAYVVAEDELRVYNVSNPSMPLLAATADVGGTTIDIRGNYAYVGGESNGLKVVDISNPPSFPLVAILFTSREIRHLTTAGNYAYLVFDDLGFTVVDISNPLAPLQVGDVDLGSGNPHDVTAAGSHVYVCANGFHVIDVSDPAAPAVVAFVPQQQTGAAAVVGDYAYVVAFGLNILDVSVPSAPQSIGTVGRDCGTVAASSTLVCIRGGGLFITLSPQCAITAAVSSQELAPDVASMEMNFPNPFSRSTVIPYQLPAAAQVSLRIYDISGRMVRVLEENASRIRGRHLVFWNGRGTDGRPLPAGVYLGRLEVGDRIDARRITLLR